jgi:hypothetical protein
MKTRCIQIVLVVLLALLAGLPAAAQVSGFVDLHSQPR